MKLVKKVLSVFLAILMLSATIVGVSAEDVTHEVGSGTTLIRAVDYISTNNTGGTRDYSFNGINRCIPISTKESVNLGTGSGLNNVYKINVAESGQYRLRAFLGRSGSYAQADVCVVSDGDVIARGIGKPGTGLTEATGLETSTFNLTVGEQDFHLRIHGVNKDPINKSDGYLFFYYFELEKVDATQSAVSIAEDSKNEIEPEDVFYTDAGLTLLEDSATIAANSTAVFYADVATSGNYAFTIKYKAEDNASLKVNNLTTDIYKNTLLPTNGDYLTYTLGVSSFNAGQSRITITPDKDLEIEKIYINKVSDESALSAINAATKEADLEAAILSAESTLDVELTDATNAIFYKKPVYNRLLKKDYSTIAEFINSYNKALISEYENPWVTLYVDNVKSTHLSTGDIKLTATTGYVPKGSTMIAVLYQNLDGGIKTMYKFSICEKVTQNTYDFIMDDVEINPQNSYTLEFFYWDGLDKVSPIDVFDNVYEEIYVSTQGNDTTGDGSEENPYATIQKALEKVDQINEYQWGDIIVNVSGGTYTITETIVIDEKYSGKNGYNVIIRGEEDNQPIISGGIKIKSTDWTEGENGIWKAPLSGVDYVRNLYINGYPAVMARSDRHYDTAESKRDASKISTTIYNVGSGENTVTTEDIAMTEASTGLDPELVENEEDYGFSMSIEELGVDFEHPVGIEFVWPYTFENHITPVIKSVKSDGIITFYMNHELLQRREETAFVTGSSFYLQNAKELINKPGEFCYDKGDGYIYYYPYSYEDMKTADSYIGNVEGMVKVAGSSLSSKVENITFENLAFRYGANNFISKYGYIGSQTDGILVPFGWSDGQIAYKAQFAVDNADNVNIEGCEFSCLGSAAISMVDSVSNSSINGNIIRDISGTGIRIGHPIHNRQRDGIEVCRNIDVTNNVIRRIAGEMFNNCAITIYYEKFINILHNDIENVPYSGMSIGWGWGGGAAYDHSDIDISYNRIKNVMNSLSDGGGIYTLGPIKNGIISNNYIEDHNAGHGGLIYNDQGSSLIKVFNNVAIDGHQTHSITNSASMSTQKLDIYDNYSDAGTHSNITAGKEINFEPYTIVTGKGENIDNPEALAIYRNSGLESKYQSLLSKAGVELPSDGREVRSELPDPALRDETIIAGTGYDLATSTNDLERVEHSNGTGVVLRNGQTINYKLNIEKAGNYKIVLRARSADVTGSNVVLVSGDGTNVLMHLNDARKITNKDIDYNYRVCTAYFTAGEKNLTFTMQNADSGIIIKEVQYCPIEQIVEPDKQNVIKIKNYNTYVGAYGNNLENYQNGYTSVGADKRVVGCVTAGANRTTTFTYDINVKEAGTYKIDAAAWIMNVGTYTVTVGDKTITNQTPQYSRLEKTDVTTIGNIELPQGTNTLKFECTMPSGSGNSSLAYLFYLTLDKVN